MSLDMSQFYQVFFEESQEHLAAMESLLLELDITNPDAEQLNAIFRAAHSIKGSSGTFGFNDLTEVTHVLETLLDKVRKSEVALTTEMVDAFLVAGDVLKNLLAAHQGQEEADEESAASIVKRLEALIRNSAAGSSQNLAAVPSLNHYYVCYVLDESVSAETERNLLTELAEVCKIEVLDQPLSDAKGKRIWKLNLTTHVDVASLRSVLDFVVNAEELTLELIDAEPQFTAAEEEAYGFFEPLDTTEITLTSKAPQDAGDDAYGFFEPLESASTTTEPLVEKQSVSQDATDGSYGFFQELPAQTQTEDKTRTQTQVASTSVSPSSSAAKSAAPKTGGADTNSIRVSVERVDQMINLVGELVITQAMLTQAAAKVDPVVFENLLNGLSQLERNTRDLQESVMSIRMLPISTVFSRFPRVVRDLSQKLGKKVQLVTVGENTELDKSLIERISDPLTHLVRNSLDHGIELPATRKEAGKVETGTITLKAYQQSGNIVIEIVDDGGGLRRDKILAKARERSLNVSDSMSDQEVWMLIFEAGFSTAEQVTEVSGRGVGMDVVKKNIAALGGRIELDSVEGVGTRVTVRLPLTLAILDGMSVQVGSETYIIPLDYVIESLQATPEMIKSISGMQSVIQVRGEFLPVIRLYEKFNVMPVHQHLNAGIMVILECDGSKAALFVDALLGQQQVVIKSLEANYKRVQGVAGATIMGDGHVALIIDAAGLINQARRLVPVAA